MQCAALYESICLASYFFIAQQTKIGVFGKAPNKMKMLGLDIGEKRIGIAISDKDEKLSAPYGIIKNDSNFKTNIEKIINEYHIKKIVIGMPYTLKGDIGIQARKVIGFVRENIDFENVDIDYFDERFTSSIPGYNIKKSNRKKKDIDKLSAAIILQDYLEKNNEIKKNKQS